MILDVLASGSAGNGYILHNESEAIVLECGCPLLECQKVLNFNLPSKRVALITHEHGDHSAFTNQYSLHFPIYATQGTIENIKNKGNSLAYNRIEYLKRYSVGRFTFMPFATQHDAKEPCGFLINHPEIGNLLFATDTYYLKYKFNGLNQIMLECNYDENLLSRNIKTGIISQRLAERVKKSHLSLSACVDILRANELLAVEHIILLHTSNNNGNENLFINTIKRATGKSVSIAKRGLQILF